MKTLIHHIDGSFYDLESLGIYTTDFVVSSPDYDTTFESADGMDGARDLETVIKPRSILLKLYMKAEGTGRPYSEMRDRVFEIFRSRDPFYVTDSRFIQKRWKVKVDGSFTPDQEVNYGFFEVDLIAFEGVAESVNRVRRQYDTTFFSFRNEGNVLIDLRSQKNADIFFRGASENLTIQNTTTGDTWRFNGSTEAGDEIIMQGVQSLKNGVSIFGETNKQILTMKPGLNEFVITGATDPFVLEIRTRFYFL